MYRRATIGLLLLLTSCSGEKRAAVPVDAGVKSHVAAAGPAPAAAIQVASYGGHEVQLAPIDGEKLSPWRTISMPERVTGAAWRPSGELYVALADHSVHVIDAAGERPVPMPADLPPPQSPEPLPDDDLRVDASGSVFALRCLAGHVEPALSQCDRDVWVQLVPSAATLARRPRGPWLAEAPPRSAPPGYALSIKKGALECSGRSGRVTLLADAQHTRMASPIWVAHQPPLYIASAQLDELSDFDEWRLYAACEREPKVTKIVYRIGPHDAWAYREEEKPGWHIFIDGREVGSSALAELSFLPPPAPPPPPPPTDFPGVRALVARQMAAIDARYWPSGRAPRAHPISEPPRIRGLPR
jgi:hypothetical protein